MNFPQASGWGFSGTDWLATGVARSWDRSDAATAYERSMYASSTAYQRAVSDLQAAGLNPMMAFGMGGHGGPAQPVNAPLPHRTMPGAGGNMQLTTAAQVANINADTERKYAERDEILARTPTHGVQMERWHQEITESKERIQRIRQDVLTGVASAAHLNQQVQNLQATLPQISAATAQLKALTKLNQAQAIEVITRSGVNEAEAEKIYQAVKQNLPQIERTLAELEAVARQMAQPGKMADEAAKASLVGQIGAYLKALLPLEGVMGAIPLGRLGHTAPAGKQPPLHFPRNR